MLSYDYKKHRWISSECWGKSRAYLLAIAQHDKIWGYALSFFALEWEKSYIYRRYLCMPVDDDSILESRE